MAKAYKCDVCGNMYEPYNTKHDKNNTNGLVFINIDPKDDCHYRNDRIELCPDCMNSIRLHIHNLRERAID